MGSGKGNNKRIKSVVSKIPRSLTDSNGKYTSWPVEDLNIISSPLITRGYIDIDYVKIDKMIGVFSSTSIVDYYLGENRNIATKEEAEYVATEYIRDIFLNKAVSFGGLESIQNNLSALEKSIIKNVLSNCDPLLFKVNLTTTKAGNDMNCDYETKINLFYNDKKVGEDTFGWSLNENLTSKQASNYAGRIIFGNNNHVNGYLGELIHAAFTIFDEA